VGLPDSEARAALLAAHLSRVTLADGVAVSDLVERTAGMTGADVTHLCHRALMRLLRRDIHDTATRFTSAAPVCTSGHSTCVPRAEAVPVVTEADIKAAFQEARCSVSAEEVAAYQQAAHALRRGSLPAAQPRRDPNTALATALRGAAQSQMAQQTASLRALLRRAAEVMRAQRSRLQGTAGAEGGTAVLGCAEEQSAWAEVMAAVESAT
jgi:AAA+ lid domain